MHAVAVVLLRRDAGQDTQPERPAAKRRKQEHVATRGATLSPTGTGNRSSGATPIPQSAEKNDKGKDYDSEEDATLSDDDLGVDWSIYMSNDAYCEDGQADPFPFVPKDWKEGVL